VGLAARASAAMLGVSKKYNCVSSFVTFLLVHANKRSNAMDNADAPTIKLISRNGDEFEL